MDDDRYTRITLRLPTELHAKLQKASERSSHSMNAEIIARITKSFDTVRTPEPAQLDELADVLAEKIADRLGKKHKK